MYNIDKPKTIAEQRMDLLGRTILLASGAKPTHLRKAWRRTVEALDAERVIMSPTTGEVIREPDHKVRLKAAEQIGVAFGLTGPGTAGPQSGGGIVVAVQICTADGQVTTVQVGASPTTSGSQGAHDASL